MTVDAFRLLEIDERSEPLGTSYLPDADVGVDLAPWGYTEQEYLVDGTAGEWSYGPSGEAIRIATHPYVTRVLVRAPASAAAFNGVVQVEPLHPDLDSAPTWRVIHPWILRSGAAWVGITQDPRSVGSMRTDFDLRRYGPLSIPVAGLGYDIVGGIARAVRAGAVGPRPVRRMYLSGWSITGSFVRVFLGDGFHDRYRLADGSPVFDGHVIAISSGGAGVSGYPPISADGPAPSDDDPRRTIGRHDVPVIELLSEFESQTHERYLRPDADAPDDRYRLYQVAGTSHMMRESNALTNAIQYRSRGIEPGVTAITELRTDVSMDPIAQAVFASLDRWVADGHPAPRADRFGYETTSSPGPVAQLTRDALGNVAGGVRTPWVEAPVATYRPHSTPDLVAYRPSRTFPQFSPEQRAALIGSMTPFTAAALADLYGTRARYLERFGAACDRLLETGFLLPDDREALVRSAAERPYPTG